MDTFIVIMQKNDVTGLFEKELVCLNIKENDEYILNIYAMKDSEEILKLYLKITTKEDVQDWEYNAIYDYYDTSIFEGIALDTIENEEEYNPTWEVILKYIDDEFELEKIINKVLFLHKKELDEVFSIISNKKGEYVDEK